jgi:penicillin amidase
VTFDARGIPHVRAATEGDAWRVLGWLHAGDRFFQMELRRRAALGRLAEVLGPAALSYDVESRRDGHGRAAERDETALSPALRAVLEAYSGGINAYLATRPLPLELRVLGDRPEAWTVRDSLAFGRLMLAGLSEAPDREIQGLLDRGVLSKVDGTHALPLSEGAPQGSNAWAVAGSRSAHGKPIVANDPHLAADLPGVWYAAHLTTADGLDVAGLTLAGVPGVIIGRNPWFAWGIAMAQVDDADLFVESIDPASRAYERSGRRPSLVTRAETIRVEGAGDVAVEFHETDRGTLLGAFADETGAWRGMALASAPAQAPASLGAFVLAARAADLAAFDRAWAAYGGPAINLCWASVGGSIGHRLAGAVPERRSSATDRRGALLEDWEGLIRDADLPRLVDPPEGFVASANDDGSAAGRPLPFPGFYASRDRVDRIRELLARATGLGPGDMNRFQNDVLSPFALRLVARIAASVPGPRGPAREALEILQAWDGRVERSGTARLFFAFLDDLAHRMQVEGWSRFRDALDDPGRSWDDPSTPREESRDDAIALALASALERVRREDGAEPASWSWGRAHTLRYEHPFSSRLPAPFLRRFLDVGPFEMPGEVHTLNVQGFRIGRRPQVRHIPSARLVIDLGDPDASTLVLPVGQSGQFQDPHYGDQAPAWAEGRTFPFPWTTAAVDRAAVSTLRLE